MKAIPHLGWTLCLLTFSWYCLHATPPVTPEPTGFRLTVDLQDGSKIIGRNGGDTLQFRSAVLGEMTLPLERIRSVECRPRTNLVQLTTANGDTLTVQWISKTLRVETAFGNLKLPGNLIRRLAVAREVKPGPRREGLVALWSGEGNGDDSAGNHPATLKNVAFAPGQSGQAFSFAGNGPQPAAMVPYSPELITSNFSFEAWIKPLAQPSNIERQAWVFGQNRGTQLVIRRGIAGVSVAFQFATGMNGWSAVASNREIPLGRFTHVAGTWDGTTLRLYVNGTLNNQSIPGTTPWDSGCEFYIGGTYHPAPGPCETVGQFFTGLIDEVGFYNRALDPAEIQADYEAGRGGD
jgi:hypothetical protein